MSDPTYPPEAYLQTESLLSYLSEGMAITFQLEDGINWPREKAERHFQDRAAILRVQELLLDAWEKAIAASKET